MIQDPLNTPEHQLFRETVRKFTEQELRPRAREFDAAGKIDKSLFKKMGDLGMLGLRYDPDYGGAGLDILGSTPYPGFEIEGKCSGA